jgi:uncharacterized membrane protein
MKTDDPLAPIVLEAPKRKIYEGGALQRRPLDLFAGRRAALSVRSLLSTTLSIVRCVLRTTAVWALALTTGRWGLRRGFITRRVRIFSRAWYRFPNDVPDRDRLTLAVYVLLAFVLAHAIVLVEAVVRGRGKWRASSKLAMVFITFAAASR